MATMRNVVPKAVVSNIPKGVGAPPPKGMDYKGKIMCIKVRLLDDSVAVFHLGHKANGEALFEEVCRHLNLLESDYFGLVFVDGYGNRCWLDKEKSILRQITNAQSDARFFFVVKFYSPNPAELEEEYTRYLLTLQLRRDLSSGEFVCNENTAALLSSFIVQSDCGDFSVDDYPDHTYLSAANFIPLQTESFQIKVMENHRKLIGMTPAEADMAFLETARRCDFYGVKLHAARDIEGTEVHLCVAHMGVRVFHQFNCLYTFSWAKIRKLSFKRRRLMIKLHPENPQFYKDTVEFIFETRDECKNFWKKCVEHHAFFRCAEAAVGHKDSSLFSRGSSFKYFGRTQKQLTDYVREHHKRREPFQRPLRPSSMGRAESVDPRVVQFGVATPTIRPLSVHEGYAAVVRTPNSRPQQPLRTQIFTQPQEVPIPKPKFVQNQLINRGKENESFPTKSRSVVSVEDPMSISLPNVLADGLNTLCRRSRSGDDVADDETPRFPDDNASEGSYRLGDHDRDPRIFSTTFTTKRVGNIIVKKVMPSRPPNGITADSSDDDSAHSDCRRSAASAPASARTSLSARAVRAGFEKCAGVTPIPIDVPVQTVDVNASISVRTSTNSAIVTAPISASASASATTIIRPILIPAPICRPVSVRPNRPLISAAHSPTNPNSVVEHSPQSSFRSVVSPSSPSKPLPGKIITKENLVLTPDGIDAKPLPPRRPPEVPPKPLNLKSKIPQKAEPTEEEKRLLEQLESILNDALDLSAIGSVRTPQTPTVISVQSEDQPDIRRLHLLNGDIPYTLTMRNLPTSDDSSTLPRRSTYSKHRQSLDLVPRNRLPKQDSFSSQDHSISPTTPDAGNIVEYFRRRRSLSTERTPTIEQRTKRDERRQTQPIKLSNLISPRENSPPDLPDPPTFDPPQTTVDQLPSTKNNTGFLETDF